MPQADIGGLNITSLYLHTASLKSHTRPANMSTLVGYDSSDEDDDVHSERPAKVGLC